MDVIRNGHSQGHRAATGKPPGVVHSSKSLPKSQTASVSWTALQVQSSMKSLFRFESTLIYRRTTPSPPEALLAEKNLLPGKGKASQDPSENVRGLAIQLSTLLTRARTVTFLLGVFPRGCSLLLEQGRGGNCSNRSLSCPHPSILL